MMNAIKKELFLRKDELDNKKLSSLYIGGGTPSMLSIEDIQSLIDTVLKHFEFSKDIEITLEANPDDLDSNFTKELSKTFVNRLSIGTQSFFDEDLLLMNRAHSAMQAQDSIKRVQDVGFENITIDLIYGSPTSNMEIWKQNLDKVIELQIPHVSSYALTIEPKTAFENWIKRSKINAPSEDKQNEQFFFMSDFLTSQGFDHYEISNFGKPNFHSKHNSAYWEYKPYLGIGPSAHSYNGENIRSWNIRNNPFYIKQINNNDLPIEREILSENDCYNEMIMIGLRTQKGISQSALENTFSKDILERGEKLLKQKIEQGFVEKINDQIIIPKKHWFFADGIASDLFIIES